ncbi:MAG: hypothetical protein QOK35_3363, partial [Pseudonocardiales bacterium]|nr:hypothetical protein [Pseudonocardiales bacterium]
WVRAVTVGELDGRPVAVSGGDDHTVRVLNLATHAAIGRPLTRHSGDVNALAIARVGGRVVLVSGSSDNTLRTWDLA